jgi:hypothetical protein
MRLATLGRPEHMTHGCMRCGYEAKVGVGDGNPHH